MALSAGMAGAVLDELQEKTEAENIRMGIK
jgi:hypothetical protein